MIHWLTKLWISFSDFVIKPIFENSNFTYVNEIRIFELIALNLVIISILIAYYSYFDKNKNETVSNTKIAKYTIISFITMVSTFLTIYISFIDIDIFNIYHCRMINTIKVCLFADIVLLFLFIFFDQSIQFYKEKYYKKMDIL